MAITLGRLGSEKMLDKWGVTERAPGAMHRSRTGLVADPDKTHGNPHSLTTADLVASADSPTSTAGSPTAGMRDSA